jgi:hypothetical protein
VFRQQPPTQQENGVKVKMPSEGAIRIGLPVVQFGGAVQEEKPGLVVQLEEYVQLRPEFVACILCPENGRTQHRQQAEHHLDQHA